MEKGNIKNMRLVDRAKTGNDAAILSLTQKYFPSFRGLLARFGEISPGEFPALVWRAATTYRDTWSSFPTWLGWCVRSHCMNSRSSEKRFQNFKELWSSRHVESMCPGGASAADANAVLELLSGHLDRRAMLVVRMKYWNGMTYREIGRRIGFSHETAKRIHDRAVEWLRRQII